MQMLFMLFSLCVMLCNVLKMSEYEAYWLTDFPLVIAPRNNYGDLSKIKKANIKKN